MISIAALYQRYLQHPNVITDSRKLEAGCFFVALKGERFDGNQYAQKAIQGGAAIALVSDPKVAQGDQYILVDDTLKTLQDLARYHRQQFHVPIIAITGSNGKTTTKELVSTVLTQQYRTHFTKGNFNNHIGLPLTLLAMPLDTEVAVIEMGANHLGEIDELCRIALPSHGLITNIGKAHLEGFGSLEGVKSAKSELYRFLAETDGMGFINLDENHLSDLGEPLKKRLNYLSSEAPNPKHRPYEVKPLDLNPFVQVAFLDKENLVQVNSRLIGEYNFNNIMTAIVLGKYFKVPSEKIKQGIEQYIPGNNRSQILVKAPNTFILDAYNANPSSMRQALSSFAQLSAATKIVILGDMLELGLESEAEHRAILALADELSFKQCIVVGEAFEVVKEEHHLHFPDVATLKTWFDAQQYEQCHFLIKGSRGIKLEQLLDD